MITTTNPIFPSTPSEEELKSPAALQKFLSGLTTLVRSLYAEIYEDIHHLDGTEEVWGAKARLQGLIIMPEGSVTDDGAGNIVASKIIVMNPISGSWVEIAAGNYTFGSWAFMWIELPPTTVRGTVITPTIGTWSDSDVTYKSEDKLLIAQRMYTGKVYWRFGVAY
jgi:hypothetical protein